MKNRKQQPPPITTTYQLLRFRTVWDWDGAETWEDVQAITLKDSLGRFETIDHLLARIEVDTEDALYVWYCVEHELPDGSQLASAERFEGNYV